MAVQEKMKEALEDLEGFELIWAAWTEVTGTNQRGTDLWGFEGYDKAVF